MPDWPSSFGSVYQSLVPDELLKQMRLESASVAQCPNFWVPREALLDSTRSCTAFEAAITLLHDGVLRRCLPSPCAGAEWWVQVYEQGKGLPFHFDKDEQLFKERQQMVHPVLSSVLYLTGAAAATKRMGPTVIVDQQYDNATGRPDPESPQHSLLIYPRRGQFAAFDGCLGHGVLGSSSSKEQRVTLLINWWSHKPHDVDPVTAAHIREHCMVVRQWPCVSQSGMQEGGSDAAVAAKTLPCQELAGMALHPCDGAAKQEAAQGGSADAASQSHASPERIPLLSLPNSEGQEAVAVTVDDLLEGCGQYIVGPSACNAVAIEHEGFLLYPLADEDELEQTQDMLTSAVLVPLHMVDGEDSDSSDSC